MAHLLKKEQFIFEIQCFLSLRSLKFLHCLGKVVLRQFFEKNNNTITISYFPTLQMLHVHTKFGED